MPLALLPAACFGKTPRHGDFVRHRLGPSLRAFDEWVGRAVYEGRRRAGFDSAYDAGAVVRFVWTPPRAGVPLVGALSPSRDRSGRRYPFIVAAEASGMAATSDVPERLAPFLDAAAALAARMAQGELDHYGLVEGLAAVDAAPAAAPGHTLDRRLSAFGADVWGDPEDARKQVLFRNLYDVMRGSEDGLRFPLGTTPAADARVWLSLTERLSETCPSTFAVYEGGPAVGSPNMLVYTGSPHANALLHLILPGTDADGVVELETSRGAAPNPPPLPPPLEALAGNGDLTLGEALDRL